jgi:hypothetical protein
LMQAVKCCWPEKGWHHHLAELTWKRHVLLPVHICRMLQLGYRRPSSNSSTTSSSSRLYSTLAMRA